MKHSQQRDIHAPGGIRTRNPSKLEAADPRLRPLEHWDREVYIASVMSEWLWSFDGMILREED